MEEWWEAYDDDNPLQRVGNVSSSSPVFENESRHSRVAAIGKAVRQYKCGHAQGWRQVTREVQDAREWAPWHMATCLEGYEEWTEGGGLKVLTEIGLVKVARPIEL